MRAATFTPLALLAVGAAANVAPTPAPRHLQAPKEARQLDSLLETVTGGAGSIISEGISGAESVGGVITSAGGEGLDWITSAGGVGYEWVTSAGAEGVQYITEAGQSFATIITASGGSVVGVIETGGSSVFGVVTGGAASAYMSATSAVTPNDDDSENAGSRSVFLPNGAAWALVAGAVGVVLGGARVFA